MRLDVNTSESIKLTAKLETLHRSAFPSAVRNTLNDLAFESKKLVPKKADENFTIRQKNIFNRMTIVNRASGFDVNRMVSKVGIDGSKGSLSDGLEKQETGGNIQGRKLLAHDKARVSGSNTKKVKGKYHFKNVSKIGTAQKRVKGSKYFRIKNGSKETVFERISKNKIMPVFIYRKTRISKVKPNPFISVSAKLASKLTAKIYQNNAEFQFKKYLR